MRNNTLTSSEISPVDAVYRQILTWACMFKKDFHLDWIVKLSGIEQSLVCFVLQKLVKTDLIKILSPSIYGFATEKERLAIYNQVSPSERRIYHQHIIDLLIAEPFDKDERAVFLYPHLSEVQIDLDGGAWLKLAGDVLRKSSSLEQARLCYEKIINAHSSLNGEKADSLFIETAISYSKTSMGYRQTSEIIATLEKALDKTKNDDKYLGKKALLKMELAKNWWLRSEPHIAIQCFQEGRTIAERTGDELIGRKIALYNIFYSFWQGRIKDVIYEYENAQPEVTSFSKNRFLLASTALAAQAYAYAGQVNQALGMAESIQQYALEIGDQDNQCYALGILSFIMFTMGKTEQALECAFNCHRLSQQKKLLWLTLHMKLFMAHLNYLQGNHDESVILLTEFLQLRTTSQIYVPIQNIAFLEMVWLIESGKVHFKKEFQMSSLVKELLQGENVFDKGLAYRYEAFMKERNGVPHEQVIRSLSLSVNWLEAAGALVEMAKSQVEIARRQFLTGDLEKARKMAEKSSKILDDVNPDCITSELRNLVKKEELAAQNIAYGEILKIGQEIINARDFRTLVLKIISIIQQLTHAERGALFIVEKGDLRLAASQNITQSQIFNPDFAFSMDVIKTVAHTGQGSIHVTKGGDIAKPSSFNPQSYSLICVPMILREQIIGVFYHDSRYINNTFKHTDMELLTYFAGQAAIAYENISSFEKLQLLNKKLNQEKEHFEEQCMNNLLSGNIIGNSPVMKKVMHKIHNVAETDSSVLILGETGSGKELIAKALHQNSLRREGPFIVVQCSALSETLLQTELFGHEKGAFTGAHKLRIGRIELANTGTLFLDEIGDISPEIQTGLLRVLQTKHFERVGGNDTIHSDFRLITATNRDLEQAVRAGTFRSDLYFRINVFPIYSPPLRERKEDIPLLVDHFLMMHSKKLGKLFKEIHQEALFPLMKYDWPGNIRELENILERAMIINQPPLLRYIDLPLSPTMNQKLISNTSLESNNITLSDNERQHIMMALEQTKWRVSGPNGAAELLKINPSTLRFRIKKLGIKKP